jgi:large subunit ribosomal protein L15
MGKLQKYIENGRLDASKTITMKHIYDSGMVGKINHGVKLLGNGSDTFDQKVDIEVTRASQSAIDSIEKCGGTITSVYYNRLGLRVLLKPEKFDGPLPKRARPPPKLLSVYTSYEKRGEFAPEMIAKKSATASVKQQ